VPLLGDGKEGRRRRIGGLLLRLLGGGGVVELSGVLPLLACLGEANLGVGAEAEGLLPAIDAVLAAPELASGRGDEQLLTVAVVGLPRLVAGRCVEAQRPGITRWGEILDC